MYTYKIQLIQRPMLGSNEAVIAQVEYDLNQAARDGWELDKLMPIEQHSTTMGAILVLRKSVAN